MMLRCAKALAQKKGYRPMGLAPSASAVKTLEAEAGIESGTLQWFLARNAGVAAGRLTPQGRQGAAGKIREVGPGGGRSLAGLHRARVPGQNGGQLHRGDGGRPPVPCDPEALLRGDQPRPGWGGTGDGRRGEAQGALEMATGKRISALEGIGRGEAEKPAAARTPDGAVRDVETMSGAGETAGTAPVPDKSIGEQAFDDRAVAPRERQVELELEL